MTEIQPVHGDRRIGEGTFSEIYCDICITWLSEPAALQHEHLFSVMASTRLKPPHENIDYRFTVRRDGVMDFMDADRLLAEWYNWWAKSDQVPAKMPDSIHTRTAVYLATRNMVPRDDNNPKKD